MAEDNLNIKISWAIRELPDSTKWLNSLETMSCSISHAHTYVQDKCWEAIQTVGPHCSTKMGGKYDNIPIHAPNDTNMNLVVVLARNTSCSVLSFEKDSELEALSSLHPGKVILPISSTFPTIDGMLFDLLSCVWLSLLMITEDHVLQTSGLQHLKKALPDKYQPMKNKKWKIVIIKLENKHFNAAPFKGNEKAFWGLYVE